VITGPLTVGIAVEVCVVVARVAIPAGVGAYLSNPAYFNNCINSFISGFAPDQPDPTWWDGIGYGAGWVRRQLFGV
jgi:hypothetical protein